MFKIEKKLTKNRKEIIHAKNVPETIIIHHTGSGNSTLAAVFNFFRKPDYLSVHYVVGRDGSVIQYVDDMDVAFHAGKSKWGKFTDLNRHSIGIEVVSDGYNFTSAERTTVVDLCRHLMRKHKMTSNDVRRHSEVAVPRGRKWDIGPNFYKPKWGSWEGFQEALDSSPNKYHSEVRTAIEWVKARGLSNGKRPDDAVLRKDQFVMMHRLWKNIKGLE